MKTIGAVEELTLRYTQFCRARLSRLLNHPEDKLASVTWLMGGLMNGGFVVEIDLYRRKLITLYEEGKKRCKPLQAILAEMERYRIEIADYLSESIPDEFGQPIYDSSVFVSNDSEKIRTVVQYYAYRILLAYLIRTKTVIDREASLNGIDDFPDNPIRRALTPGGGAFVGDPPGDAAAGFSPFALPKSA